MPHNFESHNFLGPDIELKSQNNKLTQKSKERQATPKRGGTGLCAYQG